jgi:hypothetical protein
MHDRKTRTFPSPHQFKARFGDILAEFMTLAFAGLIRQASPSGADGGSSDQKFYLCELTMAPLP